MSPWRTERLPRPARNLGQAGVELDGQDVVPACGTGISTGRSRRVGVDHVQPRPSSAAWCEAEGVLGDRPHRFGQPLSGKVLLVRLAEHRVEHGRRVTLVLIGQLGGAGSVISRTWRILSALE